MTDEEIEGLESKVMPILLDREHQYFEMLRSQYAGAEIEGIKNTVAGFYVNYQLSEKSERLPREIGFVPGGVIAHMDGLELGLGFHFFVREGELKYFEGFTFEEALPDTIDNLTLYYTEEINEPVEEMVEGVDGVNFYQRLDKIEEY